MFTFRIMMKRHVLIPVISFFLKCNSFLVFICVSTLLVGIILFYAFTLCLFFFLCIKYLCLLQCWFSALEFLDLFLLCFWMITLQDIAAMFSLKSWNTSFWEFLAFSILLRNLLLWEVFLYKWDGVFLYSFQYSFFCILCIFTIKWEAWMPPVPGNAYLLEEFGIFCCCFTE